MLDKLKELINVKSIVTILLTVVVCVLTLKGTFDIKDIYIMIISFYFGTQHQKVSSSNDSDKEE